MITLNLAPYTTRREIKKQKGAKVVLFTASLVYFFFFLSLSLVSVDAIFASTISDLAQDSVDSYEIRAKAIELDAKISRIGDVQKRQLIYTDTVLVLLETNPDGIEVDRLTFDGVNKVIRLHGKAATR
ncbi:hypothetical protein IH979_00780, partial [Patescibacteria group bacterium]|nr:hypothetical protein [Patescibacteria group bacterium]